MAFARSTRRESLSLGTARPRRVPCVTSRPQIALFSERRTTDRAVSGRFASNVVLRATEAWRVYVVATPSRSLALIGWTRPSDPVGRMIAPAVPVRTSRFRQVHDRPPRSSLSDPAQRSRKKGLYSACSPRDLQQSIRNSTGRQKKVNTASCHGRRGHFR
jgi:hypothetical protein